jgi:hypothetical protein
MAKKLTLRLPGALPDVLMTVACYIDDALATTTKIAKQADCDEMLRFS